MEIRIEPAAALVIIISVTTLSSLTKTIFDGYNNTKIEIEKVQNNCTQILQSK